MKFGSLPRLILPSLLCGAALASSSFAAEVIEPQVFRRTTGHVNEPTKLTPSDELVAGLQLPGGFRLNKFAENLGNPRMIAVAADGTVYFTRRAPNNDVWMLRDSDGDGVADVQRKVASIEHVHGITIRDGKVYLAAVRNFYVADILEDGWLSTPRVVYSDLPDAGQHPNRTVKFSPDGQLFLSIGSTANAAPEPNKENATMEIISPEGSGRRIYAKGLRNTIGFDWHPQTGELWGMDHGIDWLGDLEQREELNLLVDGGDYGWPFIYDDQKFNLHENPRETTGLTFEQYAARTAPPVLGLEPHSAPMEMLFYRGGQFPAEYQNQAFLALHGSWNRARPVGYKVVLLTFENGQPTGTRDFLTGFLTPDEQSEFGRPCGLAVTTDGALLVSDDQGGVIYRVSYAAPQ